MDQSQIIPFSFSTTNQVPKKSISKTNKRYSPKQKRLKNLNKVNPKSSNPTHNNLRCIIKKKQKLKTKIKSRNDKDLILADILIREGEIKDGLDLAELGLERWVDLVEGAAKSGELFASLVGDQKLCHPLPVYGPRRLQRYIGDFLSRSAHFLARFLGKISDPNVLPDADTW